MAENKELSSLQYKLEWEDHLHELYGDFIRRNNMDEWIYFLRRPELAEKEEAEKIAVTVLKYITTYGNISLEILESIEKIFRYSENRSKYEAEVGFEAMEVFTQHQLKNKEFPPYDLFDGFESGKDYDDYINLFRRIYYEGNINNPEEYEKLLNILNNMGISHPYEALLKCDYFVVCGAMQEAVYSLKNMVNGYHKYMALGHICAQMGEYDEAEVWLTEAVKLRANNLDGQLIGDLVMCKWYNNKPDEALDYIEGFIEAGYGHIVLPLKKMMLSEITKILMEKGKEVELSEKEMLLIKDCYKIFEDYESVIKLSEISWQKGFTDESWTVDITEAYFETGAYENTHQIIDMVYDGRKQLSLKSQLKIREIKARLLFKTGRIKDAYEIMDNVCAHPDCDTKQKYTLVKMYMTTGKYKQALNLLKDLKFYQSSNTKFMYDMGVCFKAEGEPRKAAYMFRQVCVAEPENKNAAMNFIQAIIDDDHDMSLVNSKGLLERYKDLFTKEEKAFLQGQIFEMEDRCKEAKALYKSIIDAYKEGKVSENLLNEALLRYFVMVEETGGKIGEMESEMLAYLKQYPKADLLWNYLADFYEEADYKTELREGCYQKALEANPFNSDARMMLASIYIDNDRDDKALQLFNEAILYTDSADAYMLRAYQMADRGDYEQAKTDIAAYEKFGGDKNEVLELNAALAMHSGEYEKAMEAYQLINKINKGKKAPLYDEMAICMCKLGREDEAAELMDIACENSRNPLFYTVLYNIQVHNGDFKGAKKTLKRYRKACDLGRTDEWLQLLAAAADLDSGKGQIAYMSSMAMIEPEGERFNGILEIFYGKTKAAVKLLKSALKQESDNLDNYSWLSFIYFLRGEKQEAAQVALEGLKVFENTYGSADKYLKCEPLCQYGFLKMMCGEMDDAYEALSRAAQQTTCPEFVCRSCYEAHAGLGIYHAIQGKILQANQEFNESLKERPNNQICKMIRDKMC